MAVNLQGSSVFPPRGTGSNESHMVVIDKMPKDGAYPHNLEYTTVASKLEEILLNQALEIAAISSLTGVGLIVVPLLGVGIAIGLMFLQSFFPTAGGPY